MALVPLHQLHCTSSHPPGPLGRMRQRPVSPQLPADALALTQTHLGDSHMVRKRVLAEGWSCKSSLSFPLGFFSELTVNVVDPPCLQMPQSLEPLPVTSRPRKVPSAAEKEQTLCWAASATARLLG